MKEQEASMKLPKITLDDLFGESSESIIKINLREIDSFPNHPYKVKDDDKMQDMVESVKQYGVTEPVIVRRKDNGRYEMISGHRRKRASELAGLKDINAIVKQLTDEEATILMVDSNESQRDEYLFSEKAFAYKMKRDALNRQGKRNDLTSRPMDEKLSVDIIGEENGESARQVQRYIRLTSLIPELLQMVDDKLFGFRPAVEISYLSKPNQSDLYEIMKYSEISPSLSQAVRMKKLEQGGKLDCDVIEDIMSQEKPNQIEKIKFTASRLEPLFPNTIKTANEKEDFVIMCIEEHNKRVKNQDLIR